MNKQNRRRYRTSRHRFHCIDLLSLELRGRNIFPPFFSNCPANQSQAGPSCDANHDPLQLEVVLPARLSGAAVPIATLVRFVVYCSSERIISGRAPRRGSEAEKLRISQAVTAGKPARRGCQPRDQRDLHDHDYSDNGNCPAWSGPRNYLPGPTAWPPRGPAPGGSSSRLKLRGRDFRVRPKSMLRLAESWTQVV